MRVEELSGWCSNCHRCVDARRLTVIHVPNVFTNISLFSVWLRLWGVVVNSPFVCTHCGTPVQCENNERDDRLRVLIYRVLVPVGFFVALFAAMYALRSMNFL
jgi:hypothetical protein